MRRVAFRKRLIKISVLKGEILLCAEDMLLLSSLSLK